MELGRGREGGAGREPQGAACGLALTWPRPLPRAGLARCSPKTAPRGARVSGLGKGSLCAPGARARLERRRLHAPPPNLQGLWVRAREGGPDAFIPGTAATYTHGRACALSTVHPPLRWECNRGPDRLLQGNARIVSCPVNESQ